MGCLLILVKCSSSSKPDAHRVLKMSRVSCRHVSSMPGSCLTQTKHMPRSLPPYACLQRRTPSSDGLKNMRKYTSASCILWQARLPTLTTNLVTDAGPTAIATSVFQELQDGTWVPIDHASRSLTPCEMNYSQIEESLAQAWGMNIHRYYLLGIQFDSYTNHQPLVPLYIGRCRDNARVELHRLKVQGFQYEMKYLPGKVNPCDYQSRHPLPLETYSAQQLEDMVIDMDDELCIKNHHRWFARHCHIADYSASFRARPWNAETDQSHTERIHWQWPRSQTI